MSILRLEGIHAGYGEKKVLHDLSLYVEDGEILALIGPNGAGKSTVLRVAAGFLMPEQGRVWFNGEEITGLDPHERISQGLAYCIQGGRVFPSLTVAENLEMGVGRLSLEVRKQRMEVMLKLFPNLEPLVDRKAGVLSGGERQALALGMVLVGQPQVLLLDEPSAGLSPQLVNDLMEKVHRLNRDWEITVLLVEQNIGEALRSAQRATALVDGHVAITSENPEEWLQGSELDKVFLGERDL
jgi:ABC-type branched-subunit amino acid transport system ATPase component